jgi:hypothetical protein
MLYTLLLTFAVKLEGNVFHCDASHHNLPKKDPKVSTYECGSESFERPMYSWVGIIMLILLVFLFIHMSLREHGIAKLMQKYLSLMLSYFGEYCYGLRIQLEWLESRVIVSAAAFKFLLIFSTHHLLTILTLATFETSRALEECPNIYIFGHTMTSLRIWSTKITFLTLFILLPLYLALNSYYGITEDVQAWGVSLGNEILILSLYSIISIHELTSALQCL